ncbi:aldo/keto reductase domain protein [Paraburkholderia xenovorans LB400]|nr:aldo/keto reductase domain protein [Paraburkholderia xenovorans LB400]
MGAMRNPAGGCSRYEARPAAVKYFLAYSLQRLGLDHIDVYRPPCFDPAYPSRIPLAPSLIGGGWATVMLARRKWG